MWDASDWISAVSAGITLIALLVAFFLGIQSIRETRNIQRREFKQRLLNDINDWATKVINWRLENRTAAATMATIPDVRQSQRYMHAHLGGIQDFFTSITGLNINVTKISQIFQQGLPEDIQRLINDLNTYIDYLQKWQKRIYIDIGKDPAIIDTDSIDKDSQKADELAQQAAKSAGIVLEKVADIKTKTVV